MRGAWLAAVVLTVATGGAVAPVEAETSLPRTHIAMFDSVASMVASELLPVGAIPAGRSVEITTPVPGDTLTLFEQRVVQRLRNDGVTVRVGPATTAPAVDPANTRNGLVATFARVSPSSLCSLAASHARSASRYAGRQMLHPIEFSSRW